MQLDLWALYLHALPPSEHDVAEYDEYFQHHHQREDDDQAEFYSEVSSLYVSRGVVELVPN